MYMLRRWSVRHAKGLSHIYRCFEGVLNLGTPLLKIIGFNRLERPTRLVERGVKGFIFDCQMCGQCALSRTGLSCPMNCPKELRNGPCGGVRPDGNCEVKPEMRCVWVEAWRGAARMDDLETIAAIEPPIDHRLWGRSSWIKVARERAAESEKARDAER
jgi:hypothetical protein